MSDIVERLRKPVSDKLQANLTFEVCKLIEQRHEAADEIERLRRENERLLADLRAAEAGAAVLYQRLKHVKDAADGKRGPLLSTCGQGMDGYSELANYRRILEEYQCSIDSE